MNGDRNFGLVIFIIIIFILYVTKLHDIKNRFQIADNLYKHCKEITEHLQNKPPSEIKEFSKEYFVYILSGDGSRIFVDTLENEFFDDDGRESEPEEKELFSKLKNRDTLFTHHVVNDKIYIISTAKKCVNDYCVVCFSKI